MRFADGGSPVDEAEQDVALFISDDPVVMPSVALLDSAGAEVAEHEGFPA
jgi:hypothetical protein